jgi:hypothetical protein
MSHKSTSFRVNQWQQFTEGNSCYWHSCAYIILKRILIKNEKYQLFIVRDRIRSTFWASPRMRMIKLHMKGFKRCYRCFIVSWKFIKQWLSSHEEEQLGPNYPRIYIRSIIDFSGWWNSKEAARTHGVSESFVRVNFERVVHAINNHPDLAIECKNDFASFRLLYFKQEAVTVCLGIV